MKEHLNLLDIDLEVTRDKIKQFIKGYTIGLNRSGVLLGLSGGVDSSLVLKLCCEAVGKDSTIAVILPERDSDSKNIKDAVRWARELGVKYIYKKLTPALWLIGIYRLFPPAFLVPKILISRYIAREKEAISKRVGEDIFISTLKGTTDSQLNKAFAYYKVKHRLRGTILFYYADLYNYLCVGCLNKSEWLTGFFVKYGDSVADIMPIISLYKTQVVKLAEYVGLPDYILMKKPSPDLIPGIFDEDVLGMSYQKLDLILHGIERNLSVEEISKITNASAKEIDRIKEIVEKSEYQRSNFAIY
ncbi:MAG: NAD(+) synthase [Actinobacteria bacterium]|nr:NAD(+) synthase [Actinomycetota bacterium]